MTALIICLGELLVDFIPAGGDAPGDTFRMHAGGSLLNVAVATARLGQPVALAGRVGRDLFGAFLREAVEREGVGTRWLLDIDAPTTLAFVSTVDGEPVFAFYGDDAADTRLAPDDLPEALFAETAILHTGSISLLRGTTPDAIESACARLRGRAMLSLDPNVRPGLVADEPAYRARLARLLRLVDVVKVSAADLAWLAPGRDVEAAARELLAPGPELVVVTSGGSEILALRAPDGGTDALRVPPFTVPIADTVGAGDAFMAGLLTGLAEAGATSRASLDVLSTSAVRDALRMAAATAALACTRVGADPPDRGAVDALLGRHAGRPIR